MRRLRPTSGVNVAAPGRSDRRPAPPRRRATNGLRGVREFPSPDLSSHLSSTWRSSGEFEALPVWPLVGHHHRATVVRAVEAARDQSVPLSGFQDRLTLLLVVSGCQMGTATISKGALRLTLPTGADKTGKHFMAGGNFTAHPTEPVDDLLGLLTWG